MNTITRIYGLVDPRDGQIFYVGRTAMRLCDRLNNHVRDGRKQRTPKGNYIAEILNENKRPSIVELTCEVNITATEAHSLEQQWIDFIGLTRKLYNDRSSKCGGHGNNKRFHWTPELVARLGKESDSQLANELGCDRKAVQYQREKLEIARCPQTNFVVPRMGGWNKTELPEEILNQLGTKADWLLGAEIGVSKKVIARVRRERGIPSYSEQKNHPTRFHSKSN